MNGFSKAARKERQARIASMIECRGCLDPATKRDCCGSFYCDLCYFSKSGECPWCKEKVTHSVMDDDAVRKRKFANVSLPRVLGNGLIKVAVWAFLVCGIGVLVLNRDR